MRLLLLAFACVWGGCAAVAPPADPGYETAAHRLQSDLTGASRLLAAAALHHTETGTFPTTPFALLGSPLGATTGARAVRLSALDLALLGDALVMRYTLCPSQTDPTMLSGVATLQPLGAGRYEARFDLDRAEDQTAKPLPYTAAGGVEVRRAAGTLRFLADSLRAVPVAAVATPFAPGRGVTVTFTRADNAATAAVITLDRP